MEYYDYTISSKFVSNIKVLILSYAMCMALSHECCYLLNSGASQSFSDILNLSLEDVLDQHRVLKWNVCSQSVKSSTVNVKRLRLLLFKTRNGSSKTEPNQLGA